MVNKETYKYKPVARASIGAVTLIILYFSFSIFMRLGEKNTDFYSLETEYLESTKNIEINGLTRDVNQHEEIVNFVVPIETNTTNKYPVVSIMTTFCHFYCSNSKVHANVL